jgi:type II secretory pathway pseudopilin PulG
MMRESGGSSPVFVRANRAGRRASTLIELLVVIAVVGFLIALFLPSLKRSTDLAAAAVCRHQLKEIGTSLHMYRDDNNGWLPTVDPPNPIAATRAPALWFTKLYPTYLGDPAVLRCPSDPFGGMATKSFSRSTQDPENAFASYGLNSFMLNAAGGVLAQIDRYLPRRPLDTILAADLGPDSHIPGTTLHSVKEPPERPGGVLLWGDGFDPFSPIPVGTWLTNRHGVGIHMLTIAGGVRDVNTTGLLKSPIARSYPNCAGGGCTLCLEYRTFHYSFAKDQLFWWTGPIPSQ